MIKFLETNGKSVGFFQFTFIRTIDFLSLAKPLTNENGYYEYSTIISYPCPV